ncbi:hypothetical protein COBT_000960, partial [Conglomerata obtusa]
MQIQRTKTAKLNPQDKLQAMLIKKSTINNQSKNSISYDDIPGISSIRPKIEKYIITPIQSSNTSICRKVIIRGDIGCGKTFLVESICSKYNCMLIKSKCVDILENIQKAKLHKLSLILLVDINHLEDGKEIEMFCDIIKRYRDVNIVAKTCKNLDENFKKFGCFENEVIFPIPSEKDRLEILTFLHNDYIKQVLNTQHEFLNNVSKNMPGFSVSEICKFFRNVLLTSIIENEPLTYEHYDKMLEENKYISNCVSFDDIGGLENVKNELYNSIILPTLYSESYKKLGIKNSTGILLFGPPGCGKTLIAKAVSNISHCNFISIAGPELVSKFVGDTEKELRKVFVSAKQMQPCIIFFDEIDSLCQKRNNAGHNDRIVNQILTLLDGFNDKGDVFVIGATNRIENIDEALLRPGRFDKIIEVSLPNELEKFDIFTKNIKGLSIEDFSFDELNTNNFNGADIHGL